jgi:hypothetical protein
MLVKFGFIGQQVKEFLLADDSTVENLLEIVDPHERIDSDSNTIYEIVGEGKSAIDWNDVDDYKLFDGALYVCDKEIVDEKEESFITLMEEIFDINLTEYIPLSNLKEPINKFIKEIKEKF